VTGDGFADLVAGSGPGGGPRVTAFDDRALIGNTLIRSADFFAGDVTGRGGIRVAVKNLDGDGFADLVVGSGTGAGSRVTAYPGSALTVGETPAPAFAVGRAGRDQLRSPGWTRKTEASKPTDSVMLLGGFVKTLTGLKETTKLGGAQPHPS
jgi:hypothetical protein